MIFNRREQDMNIHWFSCAQFVRLLIFSLVSIGAAAQSYPAKLVRIIVPFPAGGGIDTLMRIILPTLTENLGQPIVIENRPGAGGDLGTEMVAKAVPNGYTLLATYSSFATNAALYTRPGFDTLNDFAPITLVSTVPIVLVTNPSLPVKTVRELITLATKRPGDILYASIGSGSPAHLAAELFNSTAGVKMTHVPYKGGPQSVIALISGEAHLTYTTVVVTLPHIKAGKLRAIAVTSLERFTMMPEVPTVDQSGLPGYEVTAWYAVLAPAKTPQPIIEQLHREIVKVLKLPDIRKSWLQQGVEPLGSTPEHLGALIKADIEKWSRVVKAAGIKVD
jgi:tripartite-type tricarboxylate transporter receptor subunit TctC